jgi:hypothetical protein
MADYYSLISRAIGALPQPSIEARQSVYGRARKALVSQLRQVLPPIGEDDIGAESRALEEAITRLELEIAARAGDARHAVERRTDAPPREAASSSPQQPAVAPSETKGAASSALARLRERAARTIQSSDTGALSDTGPASAVPPAAPANAGQSNSFGATLADVESRSAATASAARTGLIRPTPPPGESVGRETQRPAAPLPLPPRPQRSRGQIFAVIGVALALLGALGGLFWYLRAYPDDAGKLQPTAGERPAGEENGKFGERLDSSEEPGKRGLPVAQRAEMWVASLNDPNKVERIYNANVLWRLENVGAGPGEPVSMAIRGDMDAPEAGLGMTIVLRKNTDPTLSASHTINILFKPAPNSPVGAVKAIGPIQMRRADAQSGEKVLGIPVPISPNYFLIGLMPGEPETRNIQLLRSLSVIDLPLQFNDGRIATINMIKGSSGERVFAEAIDSWKK